MFCLQRFKGLKAHLPPMPNLRINRRSFLTTAALTALSACSRSKGAGYYGYALVANLGDNSLAVVDLTTFRLISSITIPGSSSKLVYAPISQTTYALLPSTGLVCAIDGNFKALKTRRIANRLSGLRLAADGASLLTASPESKELLELDLGSLQPIRRHKLAFPADTVDLSSDGFLALASSSGSIELLNCTPVQASGVQMDSVGDIRFRSDGKILLVANLANRSLIALDVPTLKTVTELPLAMQPDHLCFNSDQGQMFVSGRGMDGVAIVFPFNTVVDQTILAGRNPGTMACSTSPAYLFVASQTGSDLCILDINTRKVVGFVEMGSRPSLIKVTPDSAYALVLDQDAGTMGVIRVPATLSSEARRLKTGARLFTMISVGAKPTDIAIVPRLT